MPNYNGTEGNDTYTGTSGEDTIAGNGGNDILNGGAGDDQIDGGDGSDELAGGPGNDTLIGRGGFGNVDVAVFAGNYADYEIVTGTTAMVTVTGLGGRAGDGTDTLFGIERLRFADITVSLGIDPNNPPVLGQPEMVDQVIDDGSNYTYTIPATSFIELDATPLTFTATLADGSPLPGWLTFDGSTRTFSGIPPVSVVGITYDIVVTAADQYSNPSEDFGDYQISDNFLLTINLAGGPDIVGTDGDDSLQGTFREEDLIGLFGNDRLYGSAGADRLDGGAGSDTVDYSASPQAVEVNLGNGSASGGDAQGDILISVEGVIGSALGDSLTGSLGIDSIRGGAGNDTLNGDDGDDWLKGEAGDDVLIGDAGHDRMYGGVGDDTYYVTDITDYSYEYAGEGHDRVIASLNLQLRDHVEDLELTGSAVIGKGNALDNGIIGNTDANLLYGYGGNDTLDGRSGDDYLAGAEGNDTLIGGAGYDRMYGGIGDDIYIVNDSTDLAFEYAGEGHDQVSASITHVLRANIEDLELAGTGDIRGYGNAESNLILGNSGANLLYGRDGNDTLTGNAGNDLLHGENGDDDLTGGTGQDRFYGGTGTDEFIFGNGDFAGVTSTSADRIMDFSQAEGDIIRLDGVDANSGLDGDQAFAFIGNGAFTHTAGELRYFQGGSTTYLQGDTNGDGVADFMIRLDGLHTLAQSDFAL